jgi:hypothetical protein
MSKWKNCNSGMICISDDALPATIIQPSTFQTSWNHDSRMVCISNNALLIQAIQLTSYSYSPGCRVVFKTALLKMSLKPNTSTVGIAQIKELDHCPAVKESDGDADSEGDANSDRAHKRRRISPLAH